MSMTLEEIKEKIATVIQDSDTKLDSQDIEHCMADALEHFNKDLPRKLTTKVIPTINGTDFDFPEDWDGSFSEIRAIEYPIDQNPPTFLDAVDGYKVVEVEMTVIESGDTANELDNWSLDGVVFSFNTDEARKLYVTLSEPAPGTYKVELFKDAAKTALVAEGSRVGNGTIILTAQNNSQLSGTVDVTWTAGSMGVVLAVTDAIIRFIASPGIGNPFRLLWTKRIKTLDDYGIAQIENRYTGAFVQLCAHYCAKSLAFKYANTSDPTLDADVVDYKGKTSFYQDLAALTLEEYEAVALAPSKSNVAHAVRDLDLGYHWDENKLFHRPEDR